MEIVVKSWHQFVFHIAAGLSSTSASPATERSDDRAPRNWRHKTPKKRGSQSSNEKSIARPPGMAGGLDREPRDRISTCTRRNFSSFRSGTSYQRGIKEAQYFHSIPERLKSDNTTTTTAPRPPSTQHVRQVRTQVTGDQPKNWSEKTKILDSACGVHVGARMTSTSAQMTRGQDSGDPKDAREDSGQSQEVRFRVPGSVVQCRRSPPPSSMTTVPRSGSADQVCPHQRVE